MGIRSRLVELMQLLTRRRRPVVFADLANCEPVSRQFGLDRGQSIIRHCVDSFL